MSIKTISKVSYDECVRIANAAIEKIPMSHNRIREEKYYRALIDAVEACEEKTGTDYESFLYISKSNLGTKKWPHIIQTLYKGNFSFIISETSKTLKSSGGYFRKENILAYILKEA